MTQPSADLVPDHRVAHCFGYDKAGARLGGLRRLVEKQMDDHGATAGTAAITDRCGEVAATPQSLRCGQHDYLGIRPVSCRL
ncbi:hypothetical protein Aco04nite_29870 [Winogradskya consettensis]|uniref:Uncharacterized protein n=1 Tax=Winogradskya consettensis TaxID=113560 RepID=A0A919SJY8_9ACTN|nr:hypothetical protein Aco04nite_29870 [Actinoplanes consettensis]